MTAAIARGMSKPMLATIELAELNRIAGGDGQVGGPPYTPWQSYQLCVRQVRSQPHSTDEDVARYCGQPPRK